MIFKYLLLIAIFVSALVFRKKMMEHTVGAISRGFAALNARVENWAKRQWETNPFSPYARAAGYYRFRKYEFRQKLYQKWRSAGRAKNGGSGAAPQQSASASPRQGQETRSPADRSGVLRVRRGGTARPEQDAAASAATSGPVQYLPPGGIAVRERGAETLTQPAAPAADEPPARLEPEDPAAAVGWLKIVGPAQEDGVAAVYGPREDELPRFREPAHYDLLDERGAPRRVFGAWEGTPFGPAFRRGDAPESGLYQVVRTDAGKVGSRPLAERSGRLAPQPPRFDDSLSPGAELFSARRASRGLSYQAGPSAVDAGLPGGPGSEHEKRVAVSAAAFPAQEFSQRAQIRKPPGQQEVFRQREGGSSEQAVGNENDGGGDFSGREFSRQRPQGAAQPEAPRTGEAELLSQRPRQIVFKPPKQLNEQTSQPIKIKPSARPREYPPVRSENVGERSEQSPPDGESS